jgi:hypothetical protein
MAAERTTRQRRFGFLMQADWATVSAANAAFETMYVDAGSVLPDPTPVLNTFDVTSTSGLMPKENRAYIDATSMLKRIPFSMTAQRKNLAPLFVAALQKVTEVAATPYQKVIRPAYDTAIVDFAGDGGYVFTFATDNITGSDGVLLQQAVLDSLTITIEPNAEGVARLMKVSGVAVGTTMLTNQDLSGTWTTETLQSFYNDTESFYIDVATLASLSNYCWKRYTLTINNNVISDCRGTTPLNLKFAPTITTTIELPYDSSTYTLLNTYKSGTHGSIVLETTTTTTGNAGFLNITSYGRISANPVGTSGQYESINLTLTNEVNTSAGKSLEVTIADATDRNYPAP